MTKKRKDVGPKLRFEVFKRDSFTCQYCGKKAPDVILNADHIEPVAKGGTNDISNLITSCFECNSGKGDRRISDDTVVEKQRRQLEELQERRAQIEMMLEWQKNLDDNDVYIVSEVAKFWSSKVDGYQLNEKGLAGLAKIMKKHDIESVFSAIRESTSYYLRYDNDSITKESVEIAWKRLPGILRNKQNPELGRLYYIRGIARRRCDQFDDKVAIIILRKAYGNGADIEKLEEHAKSASCWNTWKSEIENYIEYLRRQNA